MNHELDNQAGEGLMKAQEPTGIRWVAAYTVLITTGYGQYGLGFLFKGSEMIMGVVFTVLALLFAVATYGLLKRRLWGYKLTVASYTALISFEVFSLVASGRVGDSSSLINILAQVQTIVFSFWILTYLKKEKVKGWFNKGEEEAEEVLSLQEQMEEEVLLVRKRGKQVLLFYFFVSLMPLAVWLSGKISPIPKLSDMSITKGVLTNVTGGIRQYSYLVLRKDNGLVSQVRVAFPARYKPFVGKRIKVWSAYRCSVFGMCADEAYQVEYINEFAGDRNKLILDYKIVRGHMENIRFEVGYFDYLFWGIAFCFVLLGTIVFYHTKRKVKVIQDNFYSERTE